MKTLLVLLTACWSGTPQVVIHEHTRYVHDVTRVCAGLPEWPSIAEINSPLYVHEISTWIAHAGACLDVHTYPVDDLLQAVQW